MSSAPVQRPTRAVVFRPNRDPAVDTDTQAIVCIEKTISKRRRGATTLGQFATNLYLQPGIELKPQLHVGSPLVTEVQV